MVDGQENGIVSDPQNILKTSSGRETANIASVAIIEAASSQYKSCFESGKSMRKKVSVEDIEKAVVIIEKKKKKSTAPCHLYI